MSEPGTSRRRLTVARVVFLGDLCLFSCVGALHAATYGPSNWSGVVADVAPVGMVAFPVCFVTVGVLAARRVQMDQLFGWLPIWIRVICAVIGVYLIANFFGMLSMLQGSPHAVMYETRLWTGHGIVFTGIALLVAYQVDRQSRDTPVRPLLISLPSASLPRPLSKSVTLVTALTPHECAQRLQSKILPVVGGWFDHKTPEDLVGTVSETGFRISPPDGNGSTLVNASGTFALLDGRTIIRAVISFNRITMTWMVVGIPLLPVAVVGFLHLPVGLAELLLLGEVGVVAYNFFNGFREMARLESRLALLLQARPVPSAATDSLQ